MPQSPYHSSRWLILGLLGIAQLMVVLDVTVVNVALPSAQAVLHFGNDQRQWIVTAYTLAFGSMLLLGGKIGDLAGRKWTFVGGLIGFALASALGGAAQSFAMLVAARALQGVTGALLAPAGLSLLTTTFTDPTERNTAFGVYGGIGAGGASIGLLLGGVLTQALDWRAVMYLNLVFAAIAVIGALSLLHNEIPDRKPRLDVRGTIAVCAGLFAVVYGVSHAETAGWNNRWTLTFLAIGAVLLVAFAWMEAHTAEPLLPLRILTHRRRGAAFLSAFIASGGMFSVFLFLTYCLQQNLGFTPITTGLAFLPNSLALMGTAMFLTPRLQTRFTPRVLVPAGMTISAASVFYLTQLVAHSSYMTSVFPALLALGVGMGLGFPVMVGNATVGVERHDAGVASATLNTMQQIGGSIGTALLSTIAMSATSAYLSSNTVGSAASAAVHGYTTSFSWSGTAFALAAALAVVLFPRTQTTEQALEPAPIQQTAA